MQLSYTIVGHFVMKAKPDYKTHLKQESSDSEKYSKNLLHSKIKGSGHISGQC